MAKRLGIRREGEGKSTRWWITGLPDYWVDQEGPYTEAGPYDSYQDLKSDLAGMRAVLEEVDG